MSCFLLSGKKCTYGNKCKFLHPERAKQSNPSFADGPWGNTKHPATTQKQSPAQSSPVPGQSLSQVEDMAKKLTLRQESSSLKKDQQKNEHIAPAKANHRSSKRAASRKEKSSQQATSDHSSLQHGGSQEQLDSGLGSIDSQPMEASSHGSCQQVHTASQQHCRPRSAPCSCCPSHQTTVNLQRRRQCHSAGPVSSYGPDVAPHSPCHCPSYGPYPVSMPAYQHSREHHHRQPCWSSPPRVPSPMVRSLLAEDSQAEPNSKEREVVRKKLLAIFSAPLVDMAMNMCPHTLDPQMLVAKILMLQSQNRSLR